MSQDVRCVDNCEGLMSLPRECIDLVVTSPPYDTLRKYGGHSWDFYGVSWNLARVLKPGGVIVWVVADATKQGSETGSSLRQALHFQSLGLNLHDTMVWNKREMNFPDKTRYFQSWEYMFVLSKGKIKTFNPLVDRANKTFGRNRVGTDRNPDGTTRKSYTKPVKETGMRMNVWDIPGEKTAIRSQHPAVFPERLAADHIASWSNPGGVVLDPFMGSGTTAVAALELGREFIGFDVNPEYVEISKERLRQRKVELGEKPYWMT